MNIDLANPLPSILSLVTTGFMALIFITFGKWFTSKFPIPGLTELFAAA